jgi:hypothetical protein
LNILLSVAVLAVVVMWAVAAALAVFCTVT